MKENQGVFRAGEADNSVKENEIFSFKDKLHNEFLDVALDKEVEDDSEDALNKEDGTTLQKSKVSLRI